jgi:N,N-dimethylformamidase
VAEPAPTLEPATIDAWLGVSWIFPSNLVSGESEVSPLFRYPVQGYLDEISLMAGAGCRAMLAGEGSASLRIARLIHGDPNPQGPGYRDEAVDWDVPVAAQLREQPLEFGSYVEVPHADVLSPSGSFSLAVWIYPTVLSGGWHAVVAKAAPVDLGFVLYCAGQSFVTAALSHDGLTFEWCTGAALIAVRSWQLVVLTYRQESGEACLFHAFPESVASTNRKRLSAGPIHGSLAPLLFGTSLELRETARPRFAQFEGKIARPLLVDRALDAEEVQALAAGEHLGLALDDLLGAWDFSLAVDGQRVVDTSPHGNHGRAVQLPARAVTGPAWDGDPDSRYTQEPAEHDAIHFHSDDLDDARWEPTVELRVPPDARSGIYAAVVATERDCLYLPFVVRSAAPESEIAMLVPTLTWQAYSSNQLVYSYTEDGVLDPGVSLYNAHADGSMVYYSTRRRPIRAWHPSAGFPNWGSHALTSDLYLVDWLEEKGFAYDTLADEHLHREGRGLLRPYRCLILSSHPEYWTATMVNGLQEYIGDGGRVLYLGGNGLYWVTSLDKERPFVIEVRKRFGEVDSPPWEMDSAGEYEHSTTLEEGGLWRDRGPPPRRVLGVEYSANVFANAEGRWGFERLPASRDARYAFVFDGVKEETIGDFGLNLGSAAAVETDATLPWEWDEDEAPVALARASHELFAQPRSASGAPAAELALMVYQGGGAVFSAGSIAWSGSLSHNGYRNNVSQVTENVLLRFLRTPRGERVVQQ